MVGLPSNRLAEGSYREPYIHFAVQKCPSFDSEKCGRSGKPHARFRRSEVTAVLRTRRRLYPRCIGSRELHHLVVHAYHHVTTFWSIHQSPGLTSSTVITHRKSSRLYS